MPFLVFRYRPLPLVGLKVLGVISSHTPCDAVLLFELTPKELNQVAWCLSVIGSSDQAHEVDALAATGDERRDSLR